MVGPDLTSSNPWRGESEENTLNHSEAAHHVCHLYKGEDGLQDTALQFIRDGLRNGECCLYITNAAVVDELYEQLQAHGIDVQLALQYGALEVVSRKAWRAFCHKGSIPMAREVLTVLRRKLSQFSAVRIAGDVEWAVDPAISDDVLCHWEATANLVFDGLMVRVLCQYDIDRYPPSFITAALRTHPVVLYKGQEVMNPFYEASRILRDEPMFNHNSNDAETVGRMLRQLEASNQLETASR